MRMLKAKISGTRLTVRISISQVATPALAVTTRAQVLWGDSGAGKTAFAVAHFRHPLVCSTLDDLKKFDADVHDGIVLDDVIQGN